MNDVLKKFEAGFKGYHKDAPKFLAQERKKLVARKMKNHSYAKEIPGKGEKRYEKDETQMGGKLK